MSQMMAAGQQPGVPFHVNNNGPQRPTRPSQHSHITECAATIVKSSIKLTINAQSKFSLSFVYDAVTPVELSIHFGVSDGPLAHDIM
jgi:hypothetical protein